MAQTLGLRAAMALPVLLDNKVAAVLKNSILIANSCPKGRPSISWPPSAHKLSRMMERADLQENLLTIAEQIAAANCPGPTTTTWVRK